MDADEKKVPLSIAARRLKKSRCQTYRLVLIGELDAEKEGQQWMVTEASIKRLEERAA